MYAGSVFDFQKKLRLKRSEVKTASLEGLIGEVQMFRKEHFLKVSLFYQNIVEILKKKKLSQVSKKFEKGKI